MFANPVSAAFAIDLLLSPVVHLVLAEGRRLGMRRIPCTRADAGLRPGGHPTDVPLPSRGPAEAEGIPGLTALEAAALTLVAFRPPLTPVAFDPVAATGLAVAAGVCLIGLILAALWWHRRNRAPLAAFGAGALVFLVSQVILRLPWQIPLGRWVQGTPSG